MPASYAADRPLDGMIGSRAVRYAYQENPPTNLVSNEDLPIPPFRTDDWRP